MSLQGFMEMEYTRFPALDMSFNPDLFNTQQFIILCTVVTQESILEGFIGFDLDEEKPAIIQLYSSCTNQSNVGRIY